MGRQLRSTVPSSPATLHPCIPDLDSMRTADECAKLCQKENFDQRHLVSLLSIPAQGEEIYITILKPMLLSSNHWITMTTCCVQTVALLCAVMADYCVCPHHQHCRHLLT